MLGLAPLATVPLAAALNEVTGRVLASSGPYLVSGQAVALRAARKLVAATGSYALTGQSIETILSFSAAAFGRVILVGSTAAPAFGFKMIQNFEMTAGDDKTLVITVRDANGNPVSITGASIKWQCARSFGKASSISKTTSSGISITDGANGVFAVTLDDTDTESLVGNFIHEAQVTASDGSISTVVSGTMKINKALIEAT